MSQKTKNIIYYLIAAVIIYGIIYYFRKPIGNFLGIGGSTSNSTTGTNVGPGSSYGGGTPTNQTKIDTTTKINPSTTIQKSNIICIPQGAVACAKEHIDKFGVVYIFDHLSKQGGQAMCCYHKK